MSNSKTDMTTVKVTSAVSGKLEELIKVRGNGETKGAVIGNLVDKELKGSKR